MSFLIEGERVIKRFGQSRMMQFKLYVAAAAMFLAPVFYYVYFSKITLPIPDIYFTIGLATIGIIVVLIAELKTRVGSFYITNYRVVSVKGSLKKTVDSCTYDKIVNVKTVQTFLQRILRMGTIDITTYQKTEILLNSVSNPTKIEKLIYGAMEQQSQSRFGQQRQEPSRPQYQPESDQTQGGNAAERQYQNRNQLKPEHDERETFAQEPGPGRQYQSQPQAQNRPLQPYDERSGHPTQARPLLASERRIQYQSDSPEPIQNREPVQYRPETNPEQRPASQPQRKKRFKLF